ncbi:LysR family transcriptional regulator [Breoghania sp. JC706]|uniref:LysR family transcriptional regulator n=1 Tax=Breoghania sp. JC706 TaxID=3117732 RepID=UPI00300A4214
MESLSRFALFIQVVESGSFVAAGRQLGISPSAVGKGIGRLEENLGVSLFRRTTRSLSLTDEGRLLLERCRRIFCELEAIETELASRSTEPKGVLKITMPLVHKLLLPSLGRFSEAHPNVELELDFTDRLVDIVNEGFDVAIRTGDLQDSLLTSRRLGSYTMMLVASAGYLAARGEPAGPCDLANHSLLRHRYLHSGKMEDWPLTGVDAGLTLPTTIVCNNIEALMDLALEGRGIACLPDFAVRDAIAQGRMRQVLRPHVHHEGVFRVLWPSSRHASPRVRAFIDFLVAENLFAEVAIAAQSPATVLSGSAY